MKKIECVIMDWAGTAVDYGCFAPVAAFMESFKRIEMPVTVEDIRAHMGLTKIEEIRALLNMPKVEECFIQKNGRSYNDKDIQDCYITFQHVLFTILEDFSKPIPGVVETISGLREKGLKIGSTTGYTRQMMDVVIAASEQYGYKIDNCVTSDCLSGGRPNPYMIYQNMCDLAISSRFSVVKCGDTISDIKEGINAGVWSIGVVLGSSELGLTENEVNVMSSEELKKRMAIVRNRMYATGAHYVINEIGELPSLIECINMRMANE